MKGNKYMEKNWIFCILGKELIHMIIEIDHFVELDGGD